MAPSAARASGSGGSVNHNSLSSIVASLTRAQFGLAATTTATDDQLDRHVADLLLKEARDKDKQWGEKGTRAYYDPDKEKCPAPFPREAKTRGGTDPALEFTGTPTSGNPTRAS